MIDLTICSCAAAVDAALRHAAASFASIDSLRSMSALKPSRAALLRFPSREARRDHRDPQDCSWKSGTPSGASGSAETGSGYSTGRQPAPSVEKRMTIPTTSAPAG